MQCSECGSRQSTISLSVFLSFSFNCTNLSSADKRESYVYRPLIEPPANVGTHKIYILRKFDYIKNVDKMDVQNWSNNFNA